MKFIPILFQTLMVQAILEGRKTTSRRLNGFDEKVKEHPDSWKCVSDLKPIDALINEIVYPGDRIESNDTFSYCDFISHDGEWMALNKCRYGQIGDVLWVRESFAPKSLSEEPPGDYYWYRADYSDHENDFTKWKPSIHMPKTACRIFLEITNITVERLQDISEEDAIAEGVQSAECSQEVAKTCISSFCKTHGCDGKGTYYSYPVDFDGEPCYSATESFETLWQSINGVDSWEANPWVWVISFKKIPKPHHFI